jgi:hypothetical protein
MILQANRNPIRNVPAIVNGHLAILPVTQSVALRAKTWKVERRKKAEIGKATRKVETLKH